MNSIFRLSPSKVLIVSALVALLVLPCAAQTQAAEKPTTTTAATHEKKQTIQEKRIAEGYAVMGPLELKGASSSELVIGTPPDKPAITVSLKSKKVSVMDEVGNGLTMSSVKSGTTVIICQKKDSVIIYVVPPIKKESRDAK